MSGPSGGCAPRRPLRQLPVVDDDDVGCSCPKQRLLFRSLLSSLMSRASGALGSSTVASRPKSTTSSSWASTTTTTTTIATAVAAFTSTSTIIASATTVDSSADSWGPATYEARRQSRRRRQRRRRRVAREDGAAAVAVEVESAAPYEDFRESMMAMVVEKEMYAWEELNALLHQFLTLNSPRHHALILHAFADLWAPRSGLFCPLSPCLAL